MSAPSVLQRLRRRWSYFQSLPAFQAHPLTTVLRALSWRLHCALQWPGKVWVPAWQAHIHVLPEWHGAGVTLFYVVRDLYEPELTYLNRFLKPGDTFVDAGANCGLYTVAGAHFVGPKGRVLAFEPGPAVLPMLEQNVTSNHLDQVKIERCGLAAEAGKARLYKHPHGASSATLGHAPGAEPEFFEIPLDTLDAVLDRHGIESVDLIKMDVEGAEELILRGATQLFERSRPKVLFEINPEAIPNLGLALDGAWAFLAARGYRFFELNPAGQQTPLHVAPAGGGNIVALPPENSEAK